MSTTTNHDPDDRRTQDRTGPQPSGPVLGVFRWVGQHVEGFHAAVGALLFGGLAVILICVTLFAALADEVMEGDTLPFDRSVLLWMNRHASPQLTGLALDVTALGAGTVVWLVVIVGSVFLWVSRHRWSAALLWVSILGSGLINTIMKMFFHRERPHLFPWRVPYAGLSSFPSGHSMTAMVCYATLAYLIARLVPSKFLRYFTFSVAALIIVLIGLSRLYLGVHYPTDVAGGLIMGLAWSSFCALGLEALRFFRHRQPEVAAQEQDLEATVDEGPADDRGNGKKASSAA
ncbi:MAG: phosphatase PAP2 family protein [Gemmatimonadetes bacterium]|nr:phosphatase PAP2 family protein [Gemmatimonadota bacterium]